MSDDFDHNIDQLITTQLPRQKGFQRRRRADNSDQPPKDPSRGIRQRLLGAGKGWVSGMLGLGLMANGYRAIGGLFRVVRQNPADKSGQNRWESFAEYVRAYRLSEKWLMERRRQTRITGAICYFLSAACLAEMVNYGIGLTEGTSTGGLLPLIAFPAFAALFFATGLTNMWRALQIRVRQFIPFMEFLRDARMWGG